MIDSAKNETYQMKIEEGKNDPRSVWKLFQQFGTNKKGSSNDSSFEIKVNDNIISNDQNIANAFNDFFVNIPSKLKEPIKPSEFELFQNYVKSKVNDNTNFSIPLVKCSFVSNYLSSRDVAKSTGLDSIGPRLLKIAPNALTPGITYMINKSLASDVFPGIWKHAKVNPIFKAGSKDEVNNYRPISILPTLSKLIEKWIQIKLMSYLNNHTLLHENQSGFRKITQRNRLLYLWHPLGLKLLMRVNWLDVLW